MIGPSYTYSAVVLNIVDGDTCDADVDFGDHIRRKLRLRLARIDTCEMNASDPALREKALAARDFVKAAILDKRVVLTTTKVATPIKTDSFGRYLAEVYYMQGEQQVNLSTELLEKGLATLFVK